MKRLTIKKLIVISQSESRSLEVPFENGLNIILGGNKTGKSSIIKSIFTTLPSLLRAAAWMPGRSPPTRRSERL